MPKDEQPATKSSVKPDIKKSTVKTAKSYKASPQQIRVGLLVISCLVAGLLGGWISSNATNNGQNFDEASSETKQQFISSESDLIAKIATDVSDSVVSINVKGVTDNGFFGSSEFAGAGTGIIVSSEGMVMTNRHVVPEGVDEIVVILNDGTELPAKVVARDNVEDIAFIKITDAKGSTLKAAKLGDSSATKVGDKVVAIGNALGEFQNSVTTGIISGKGRPIVAYDGTSSGDSLRNLIQTDAAINEGNSGGPLLNLNGEVIGINVAKSDSSSENIGFAIPVNNVSGLVKSVLASGKIVRPYLGVRYVTLTDAIAKQENLPVNDGAYIAPPTRPGQVVIVADSPAEGAGLLEGDIIIKINDIELNENVTLVDALAKFSPGDKVVLSVQRGSKVKQIEVTLSEAPKTSQG